jgi:hypothetical protein
LEENPEFHIFTIPALRKELSKTVLSAIIANLYKSGHNQAIVGIFFARILVSPQAVGNTGQGTVVRCLYRTAH